jgi:hypothetical protein
MKDKVGLLTAGNMSSDVTAGSYWLAICITASETYRRGSGNKASATASRLA